MGFVKVRKLDKEVFHVDFNNFKQRQQFSPSKFVCGEDQMQRVAEKYAAGFRRQCTPVNYLILFYRVETESRKDFCPEQLMYLKQSERSPHVVPAIQLDEHRWL